MSWIGWFVYSLVILVTFTILKVINLRLHSSLGSDPIEEPEEEQSDSDKEEEEGEGEEKDKKSKDDGE